MILFRFFALIFLFFAFHANARVLRVVTDDNYPPYLFLDQGGKPQGYEADLWKLWEKKTGIRVELAATDWASAQKAVLDGRADVIDMIFKTPRRELHYDFSPPYAKLRISIYADSSLAGIQNAATLRGFVVGVEKGDACEEKLQDLGVHDLRLFQGYADMIRAAESNEIRIFCMDEFPAAYYLYRFRKQKQFVRAFNFYQGEFRRAVRKGDRATLEEVERGMALITPEEKNALREKWMGHPVGFRSYTRYLGYFLLSSSIVGLIMLLWIRSLMGAVKRRTRELENEKAQLRTLIDNSPDLVVLKDRKGVYIACNGQAARLMGSSPEQVAGKTDDDFFSREVSESFRENDRLAIEAGGDRVNEEWVTFPDTGEKRLLEVIKTRVMGERGEAIGVLGVGRDITERRKNEEKLREQDELLREMSALTHSGAWGFDPQTGKGEWTEEVAKIHEVDPSTGTSMDFGLGFFHGEHRAKIEAAVKEAVEKGTPYDLELEMITARGNRKWVRTICHPVVRDGKVLKVRGSIQDITDRKMSNDLIWRQANYDSLTNLPNRRLFQDRLDQDILKASRSDSRIAVLFLDIDRFREINESMGHAMGDSLLVEAASRIGNCLKNPDTLARLGGDEFAVILENFGEMVHLDLMAREIIRQFSEPFDFGGGNVAYVSVSIGITIFPQDGREVGELMKNAEQAMYSAKEEKRSHFGYFTSTMHSEVSERLSLTNDLRQALSNGELVLHFQPIVAMQGSLIGKAEVLLRWNHPKRGLVSPESFIPLAEETGLIVDIGEWVFARAIESILRWKDRFGRIIELSVNKSPLQFEFGQSYPWMDQLEDAGLPGGSITVEITEGLLIRDSEKVRNRLIEFRNQGIEVSIDDFGTGFSSLSYLRQFHIDYLKIDKSFVKGLAEDESDRALAEAIVVMAHKLGIRTIAEGVETELQRQILEGFGCDYFQGYLFSRPVPASEFENLL